MNNRNYQKILQNTLKSLQNKPKLLLHVCCGPCSTIPLKQLDPYFNITLMYNNSNIYPYFEYERRFNELSIFIKRNYPNIKIIQTDYDNESFNKNLDPYKDLPEGHERCRVCFKNRLNEGFNYASKNGFDYYGTVMTISRYKNAQDINQIGEELQGKYPNVKWLYADFKKNNGYEESLIFIKENKMYFQEYCGCKYSFEKYKNKQEINKK